MPFTWQRYRFWQRLSWILFLGTLLVFFPVAYLSELLKPSFGDGVFFLLMGAWMFAWLYASVSAISVPCPRCGQPFFYSPPWYGNPLATKCVHCGLPKWTEPDEKSK